MGAITSVLNGEADGVIFDRMTLAYYLNQNPNVPLQLSDFNLDTEYLGFVLPYDSPLAVPLDVSIIAFKEDSTLNRITQEWIQGEGP